MGEPIQLSHENVALQTVDAQSQEQLNQLGGNPAIWQTFELNDVNRHALQQSYVNNAFKSLEQGKRHALVVSCDGRVVGSSSFYKHDPKNAVIKVGYTWFIPDVWGSGVNPTVKYLMLNYAFAELGVNRVEFTVDSVNEHSQKAMQKIGAIREGILRQAIRRADGSYRDTVVFSILADDWPGVAQKLVHRFTG